ncbi:hypothetical protein BX666DRAFT_2115645 [Dichotomocladium elegans]|nr:hypothetical protein BX666DRAFT_2115645 [Dichotomocladium elegans]
MTAETEFDQRFVKYFDELCQQEKPEIDNVIKQTEVIHQLEKDRQKLKSTLFEYQQRYRTPALLDDEYDQIEDDLLEIMEIRDENARLKRENEQLTLKVLKWEIALGRADVSSFITPMQIGREYLHYCDSCRQAEAWVKLLEFELWTKENERM